MGHSYFETYTLRILKVTAKITFKCMIVFMDIENLGNSLVLGSSLLEKYYLEFAASIIIFFRPKYF